MKRTKVGRAILLIVASVALAASVSGCLLLPVPVPVPGGHGGYHGR